MSEQKYTSKQQYVDAARKVPEAFVRIELAKISSILSDGRYEYYVIEQKFPAYQNSKLLGDKFNLSGRYHQRPQSVGHVEIRLTRELRNYEALDFSLHDLLMLIKSKEDGGEGLRVSPQTEDWLYALMARYHCRQSKFAILSKEEKRTAAKMVSSRPISIFVVGSERDYHAEMVRAASKVKDLSLLDPEVQYKLDFCAKGELLKRLYVYVAKQDPEKFVTEQLAYVEKLLTDDFQSLAAPEQSDRLSQYTSLPFSLSDAVELAESKGESTFVLSTKIKERLYALEARCRELVQPKPVESVTSPFFPVIASRELVHGTKQSSETTGTKQSTNSSGSTGEGELEKEAKASVSLDPAASSSTTTFTQPMDQTPTETAEQETAPLNITSPLVGEVVDTQSGSTGEGELEKEAKVSVSLDPAMELQDDGGAVDPVIKSGEQGDGSEDEEEDEENDEEEDEEADEENDEEEDEESGEELDVESEKPAESATSPLVGEVVDTQSGLAGDGGNEEDDEESGNESIAELDLGPNPWFTSSSTTTFPQQTDQKTETAEQKTASVIEEAKTSIEKNIAEYIKDCENALTKNDLSALQQARHYNVASMLPVVLEGRSPMTEATPASRDKLRVLHARILEKEIALDTPKDDQKNTLEQAHKKRTMERLLLDVEHLESLEDYARSPIWYEWSDYDYILWVGKVLTNIHGIQSHLKGREFLREVASVKITSSPTKWNFYKSDKAREAKELLRHSDQERKSEQPFYQTLNELMKEFDERGSEVITQKLNEFEALFADNERLEKRLSPDGKNVAMPSPLDIIALAENNVDGAGLMVLPEVKDWAYQLHYAMEARISWRKYLDTPEDQKAVKEKHLIGMEAAAIRVKRIDLLGPAIYNHIKRDGFSNFWDARDTSAIEVVRHRVSSKAWIWRASNEWNFFFENQFRESALDLEKFVNDELNRSPEFQVPRRLGLVDWIKTREKSFAARGLTARTKDRLHALEAECYYEDHNAQHGREIAESVKNPVFLSPGINVSLSTLALGRRDSILRWRYLFAAGKEWWRQIDIKEHAIACLNQLQKIDLPVSLSSPEDQKKWANYQSTYHNMFQARYFVGLENPIKARAHLLEAHIKWLEYLGNRSAQNMQAVVSALRLAQACGEPLGKVGEQLENPQKLELVDFFENLKKRFEQEKTPAQTASAMAESKAGGSVGNKTLLEERAEVWLAERLQEEGAAFVSRCLESASGFSIRPVDILWALAKEPCPEVTSEMRARLGWRVANELATLEADEGTAKEQYQYALSVALEQIVHRRLNKMEQVLHALKPGAQILQEVAVAQKPFSLRDIIDFLESEAHRHSGLKLSDYYRKNLYALEAFSCWLVYQYSKDKAICSEHYTKMAAAALVVQNARLLKPEVCYALFEHEESGMLKWRYFWSAINDCDSRDSVWLSRKKAFTKQINLHATAYLDELQSALPMSLNTPEAYAKWEKIKPDLSISGGELISIKSNEIAPSLKARACELYAHAAWLASLEASGEEREKFLASVKESLIAAKECAPDNKLVAGFPCVYHIQALDAWKAYNTPDDKEKPKHLQTILSNLSTLQRLVGHLKMLDPALVALFEQHRQEEKQVSKKPKSNQSALRQEIQKEGGTKFIERYLTQYEKAITKGEVKLNAPGFIRPAAILDEFTENPGLVSDFMLDQLRLLEARLLDLEISQTSSTSRQEALQLLRRQYLLDVRYISSLGPEGPLWVGVVLANEQDVQAYLEGRDCLRFAQSIPKIQEEASQQLNAVNQKRDGKQIFYLKLKDTIAALKEGKLDQMLNGFQAILADEKQFKRYLGKRKSGTEFSPLDIIALAASEKDGAGLVLSPATKALGRDLHNVLEARIHWYYVGQAKDSAEQAKHYATMLKVAMEINDVALLPKDIIVARNASIGEKLADLEKELDEAKSAPSLSNHDRVDRAYNCQNALQDIILLIKDDKSFPGSIKNHAYALTALRHWIQYTYPAYEGARDIHWLGMRENALMVQDDNLDADVLYALSDYPTEAALARKYYDATGLNLSLWRGSASTKINIPELFSKPVEIGVTSSMEEDFLAWKYFCLAVEKNPDFLTSAVKKNPVTVKYSYTEQTAYPGDYEGEETRCEEYKHSIAKIQVHIQAARLPAPKYLHPSFLSQFGTSYKVMSDGPARPLVLLNKLRQMPGVELQMLKDLRELELRLLHLEKVEYAGNSEICAEKENAIKRLEAENFTSPPFSVIASRELVHGTKQSSEKTEITSSTSSSIAGEGKLEKPAEVESLADWEKDLFAVERDLPKDDQKAVEAAMAMIESNRAIPAKESSPISAGQKHMLLGSSVTTSTSGASKPEPKNRPSLLAWMLGSKKPQILTAAGGTSLNQANAGANNGPVGLPRDYSVTGQEPSK